MSIDGSTQTCTHCGTHVDACTCPKQEYQAGFESEAFDAGVAAGEARVAALLRSRAVKAGSRPADSRDHDVHDSGAILAMHSAADAIERREHVSPQEPTRSVSPQDTSRCCGKQQVIRLPDGDYPEMYQCVKCGMVSDDRKEWRDSCTTGECERCGGDGIIDIYYSSEVNVPLRSEPCPDCTPGECERCGGTGGDLTHGLPMDLNPCPDCGGTGETKEQG